MLKDLFPYQYLILNFTEIKKVQRDLSIPVKKKHSDINCRRYLSLVLGLRCNMVF
jgi:hypothetical protein